MPLERKAPDWRATVRAELRKRKIPEVELGRRLGLKRPQDVTRWLDGDHEPRWNVVVQIADELGWRVSTLLSEEGIPDDDVDPAELRRFWLALPANARKVVRLLDDPRAARFLAKAADQYVELTRSQGP